MKIQHLHWIGRPGQLGRGREDRPPENHRHHHDHQMLHDVNAVVLHRHIVERRQMPGHEHEVEGREGARRPRQAPAEPQHEGMTEERREHPARRAVEQQRRHREDQQEMLDHVRAEQVVVREIVDRARQRPQQQGQPREERDDVGRLRPQPLGAPAPQRHHVQAAERQEARDHRGIGMPCCPVKAVGPEGRWPRGPGSNVRHAATRARAGGRSRRAP